ncbi:response regulator [Hydrogenophaga sp.]|jgi:two-component system OmpR family response regulator|uniref:response regulator n=1 Tax=Hydrogenophaga sp. TaxID=1904254 RepID=UPI00271F2D20|nr:response regulator [Hydrogenophaga sp.]MDZ4360974.1 response regulator [Variovorax sp.]MDO9253503.1 response regulator [Hydrogenophaga sp.]MDP2022393.1 response regulator [Hydrogenophaga sp.]MDP3322080.1 response regulator [Hydrogenophaga sp.]MDP3885131.1 response regulator [Hydrogenophaga sp.]
MSPTPEHLLVVDDDREIRRLIEEYLTQAGYRVSTAADGKAMRRLMEQHRFDLVVLDLMLPGEDGLSLCRDLRSRSNLPILMLTARGSEIDRIVGLEMGADDYLAKPFNPRELLARIRSILRRAHALPTNLVPEEVAVFRFAGWTLEVASRNVTAPDGLVVPLSGAEFRLLRVLLEHPHRVFSRDQLLELTNGREAILFDRSIDVLVGRLRKRLRDDGKEPALIKTVRGEGYVLAASVEAL